jgi:hypothetical protein
LSIIEERPTLGHVVVDLGTDADVLVDELIINSSLALLIPEDDLKLRAFCDVVSFIEKVMYLGPLIVLRMSLSFNSQYSKLSCLM